MRKSTLVAGCLLVTVALLQRTAGLLPSLLHPLQWFGAAFCWPTLDTQAIYRRTGQFNPRHCIATRLQIAKDDAFMVLPRYKCGVPATLVRTCLKQRSCQAMLEPFPCWKMQEEDSCESLTNAVDLCLDIHDTLWVLDIGIVNTLEQPVRKSNPRVLGFNTKTGQVIRVVDLDGLTSATSRLQYLVVDFSADGNCFLYISDAAAKAIIVYDLAADKGFRVVLPKIVTAGCNSKRDVLYLALARKCDGSSSLYFTYLSGQRMFSIDTQYLQCGDPQAKVDDCGPKPGRLIILGTDNGAAIFFRYEGLGDVYRWDANTCFHSNNFVAVHRTCESCLLATHVAADYRRDQMRLLESNFPDFLKGCVGCGAYQTITTIEGGY
ncbi:major royal jelly protein 3 isoform X2 [Nilaparvata lugens]|nr:major royal jelly protein 3 isoform X2 [Nilaparvata lugens]